jgi:hypothetical protein
MTAHYSVIVSFFFFSHLFGTPTIHLFELPQEPIPPHHFIREFDNQLVQVQGFWTPLSEQSGILACQPNVKSCCAGNPEFIHRQIFLSNVFDSLPSDQIVEVEGFFSIDPKDRYLYHVKYQKKIEKKQGFSLIYLFLGGIVLVANIAFFKRMKNRFVHF